MSARLCLAVKCSVKRALIKCDLSVRAEPGGECVVL